MYIVWSKVRALINKNGKLGTRSYKNYLDRKIESIVMRDIKLLGSRKMMDAADAEALEAFNMTSS